MIVWVYILKCADGSYYTGTHRGEDVAARVWEHQSGQSPKAYTYTRRPVECVWAESFDRADEAVAFERQIKGWNRKKKEALIRGDWAALPVLSKRGKVGDKG